jgi:hypothetical protein
MLPSGKKMLYAVRKVSNFSKKKGRKKRTERGRIANFVLVEGKKHGKASGTLYCIEQK